MEKKLPDNFYWGGSVSSFQTEGARNEGGKGVCIYDVRPTDPEFSDWSVGIDEYHRYDEDIALMKDMGFNFYRFSICWSRIIPDGTLDEPVKNIMVLHHAMLLTVLKDMLVYVSNDLVIELNTGCLLMNKIYMG